MKKILSLVLAATLVGSSIQPVQAKPSVAKGLTAAGVGAAGVLAMWFTRYKIENPDQGFFEWLGAKFKENGVKEGAIAVATLAAFAGGTYYWATKPKVIKLSKIRNALGLDFDPYQENLDIGCSKEYVPLLDADSDVDDLADDSKNQQHDGNENSDNDE